MFDYHVHTLFSEDSTASMESQCEAAIARGIRQIAFTEHEDYNPKDPTSFYFKHADYMAELQRCRALFAGRLIIRAGIEVSEPHRFPDLCDPVLAAYEWDFVLGSLHWLSKDVNTYWPEFFEHTGDWRRSMQLYFEEAVRLVETGDFDVLAHIDYPTRYNRELIVGEYDIRDFESEVREILRAVVACGKGIEINTNPMRSGRQPNPADAVIHWYREMGGEILTIGTDSHTPSHTGLHMPEAVQIARAAGFTHLATFERRNLTLVPIE
ncbi:MAG: histidinol-phosphatase HisJ family protein [Chloroflexi bacterium]|nr:histidinol-phosphatase HisJ family protein [Chloroflexota bacterium]